MATIPYAPQAVLKNTDQRASMDQERPTEKPKKNRLKDLRDRLRPSKHDEKRGQDVNSDSTSEKDQNEIITAPGNELTTIPKTIQMRKGSLAPNGLVSSPTRPVYPQNESVYSDDTPPRLEMTDVNTPGNGVRPPPSGESDLRLELVQKDNQLLTLGELPNINRSMKQQLEAKDQEISYLKKQRDNAEQKFGYLNGEIVRVTRERDEAIRRHDEVDADYTKSIMDLDRRTSDLRKAKKDLEEGKAKWAKGAELRQLQELISALKEELDGKEKIFQKWKKESEIIKAERDRLREVQGRFEGLEKTFKHTLDELEERNRQLFKAQEDYETIQQKHTEVSTELMRMKIESRSDVDDAFFISRYQNLQSDIRTWAQNYFWGEERKRSVLYSPRNVRQHPSIHDDLEELSEDCLNLLVGSEDGSTRPFVAEAYLWKFIEEKIFHSSRSASSCSKGLFWAHKLRPEMARMEKFLQPGPKAPDSEARMFYKWKANTAKLVIRRLKPSIERTRIPVDPDVMDFLATQVLHVLGEWMSKHEKQSRHEEACRNALAMILQAAIDFDSHIHEEWSRIFATAKPVGWEHRYGYPFDDRSMKPGSQYIMMSGELVGIVLSPALIRSGISSGDCYNEVQEILVPSRVLPQGFAARTQKPRNAQSGGAVMRGVQQRIGA